MQRGHRGGGDGGAVAAPLRGEVRRHLNVRRDVVLAPRRRLPRLTPRLPHDRLLHHTAQRGDAVHRLLVHRLQAPSARAKHRPHLPHGAPVEVHLYPHDVHVPRELERLRPLLPLRARVGGQGRVVPEEAGEGAAEDVRGGRSSGSRRVHGEVV